MTIRSIGAVSLAAVTMALVFTSERAAARQATAADRKVDAITLAIAVRDGKSKQYEGYTVTGEGRSFDTNCTPADPAKKIDASIPLALAALGADGKTQPLVTLEDWVNLQMVGRPMLMGKLRGPDPKIQPEPDPQRPVLYTFTARFTGETESVTPAASILDNNPKPFTVPILVDAPAKKDQRGTLTRQEPVAHRQERLRAFLTDHDWQAIGRIFFRIGRRRLPEELVELGPIALLADDAHGERDVRTWGEALLHVDSPGEVLAGGFFGSARYRALALDG